MNHVVVIGGHTRNIGKTSLMAALIRDLQPLGWTALKITQYGHGICSRDGRPCGCAPGEHPFMLTEERDVQGRADTSRFLAAGARSSLWLRVRQGQLADSMPTLCDRLRQADWVMIESNSIVEWLEPSLYLVVLDSSRQDFKVSARRGLNRADAFVTFQSDFAERAWRSSLLQEGDEKPVFRLQHFSDMSPQLRCFVRQRLFATVPCGH